MNREKGRLPIALHHRIYDSILGKNGNGFWGCVFDFLNFVILDCS
jgi:hypothetical protein